ncbi:MAG TPA: hypothetical protein VI548_00610 [Chitinophagaceae bacterium]|nr:hypothetical protein [Chitinophagaceae bacterium]
MRIKINPFRVFLVVSLLFLLNGCVKDQCTSSYSYWEPVYKTKAETRANIKNNAAREIERPGKIYIRGNYIFLNEIDRGIHIIDNTNPSAPQNISFIDIPGNMDMAVKGNILYADFYTDLVTIDITDPRNTEVKKFTENIFPERFWGNGFSSNPAAVVVDWIRRDTVIETNCGGSRGFFEVFKSSDVLFMAQTNSAAGGGSGGSPFGVGGSMARFTIVNNHLYAVSESSLNVVSIANAIDPVFSNKVNIGWGIETIYPFNNRLFIGSNTGMFIFNISNPALPVREGSFSHVRSCDPVIADNTHAYVTLRSGNACQGFTNQLDVLDISNFSQPTLVKTYQLKNPHGLAKDRTTLIICDGAGGLKFYNASNVNNLVLLNTISGYDAYDVIAINGWALVVAKNGLYQYTYNSSGTATQLSVLAVKN